jgi:hypothetical protein
MMSPPTPRRALDWAGVLLPLAVSVAANLAWALHDGSAVAVVAGVATPLLLVLSVERWRADPGLVGWRWWARLFAMGAVTGVAASVSWTHIALLLAPHWGLALAWAAPLAVDGLAVLGTLTLWPPERSAPVPERTTDAERVRALRAAEPDLGERKLGERLGVSRRVVRAALAEPGLVAVS